MQRCQGQPSTCAIAFFKPACASETTSSTPVQAALDQAAQEAAPEGLRLRLADVEGDHLPVARLVHAVGEHEALAHDAASVSDLLHLGVQPQVRIAALERPVAEGVDLLVQALADPRDLALGDPQPQRLDHLVDLARGDTGDIRLLHDRDERLLGAPPRLEEAREVAAAAELGDRQLDLARARRPRPRPVAVAMGEPLLRGALAAVRADQLRHLRLHQLLHDPAQRLAQEVKPLALQQVADNLLNRHPLRLGHRGDSSRRRLGGLDEFERRGGRKLNRLRPTRSYTTLWDVTRGRAASCTSAYGVRWVHRTACGFPLRTDDDPAICPLLLMSVAWLHVPATVPRSVIVPCSQITAWVSGCRAA